MTRANFIKQLIAANSFIWTNIKPIAAVAQIVFAPKYHRATPIKEFLVRGVQFSKGKKSVGLISKFDPIDLVTEPSNPYDQFAVAVYWKQIHIGYYPAEAVEVISNMAHAGYSFYAEVAMVNPKAPLWEAIEVMVYFIDPRTTDKEDVVAPSIVLEMTEEFGWQRVVIPIL